MSDRLTEADLTRIRAEHWGRTDEWGRSNKQFCARDQSLWPCDAARLLAHFAPGPVPHLAGIAAGLLGPTTSEELPSVSRP